MADKQQAYSDNKFKHINLLSLTHHYMKLKAILLFLVFSLIFVSKGKTQYVDFGQDPAYLRWKQIKTENFQLIYPDFFEENAQKMANIYTTLYKHANTLGHRAEKISMVIHPDGGISNGSVAWAPKRSDLYATPPQEPSDTWLEHLCVHEFRHVVQISTVNQGFTKILYYLFGEQISIAVLGVYVPMWFMEGDAVCFESSVGHLGRGRSPEFLNEMKAQVVDKKIYSYYKAVLGSYKDFVPNQYSMGYYMVAQSRNNYGTQIWADAIKRVGHRPWGITPFARSLKISMQGKRDTLWSDTLFRSLFVNPDSVKKANTYGDAKRTLYHDNFSELKEIWKKELTEVTPSFDTVETKNRFYTNYYYPTPSADGKLIAYKKGLQETGAFVALCDGKEKLLTRTGILYDYSFTLHQNAIWWSEYRPSPRWAHGGKMEITKYDWATNKYKRYKSQHNRFSPFSTDNGIGFVEVNNKNEASIIVMDSQMNKEIFKLQAQKSELFIHPRYENGKIVTTVQSEKGIRIESIDIQTGEQTRLSDNMWYELDNPNLSDNRLLYRASFNGNNSFYTKDLSTGNSQNIITSKYGVNFPTYNSTRDTLFFSFYTADGYKPGKLSTSEFLTRPIEVVNYPLADSLRAQEKWTLPLTNDSLYHSKKYNKTAHLINIHSWGPLYIDAPNQDINIGLTVNSQNKLSTLSFTTGYVNSPDYEGGAFVFNGTYSGWWPIFEVNLESGKYNYWNYYLHKKDQTIDTLLLNIETIHTKFNGLIRFPFNFSSKNFSTQLQPYVKYELVSNHHQKVENAYNMSGEEQNYSFNVKRRYYQLIQYGLSFNNQSRMTSQEINPRWGQLLQFGYAHSVTKSLDLGTLWWGAGSFYLPGFFRNHSFSAYLGHQEMSDKFCYYDNEILSPRGIKLYGHNISSARFSYKSPLAFPDWNISSIFYIKGIDGGVFFDYGNEKNLWTESRNLYSYGMELTADTHLFRLPFPINVGVRTGYETLHRKMFADLLLSIGLSI